MMTKIRQRRAAKLAARELSSIYIWRPGPGAN